MKNKNVDQIVNIKTTLQSAYTVRESIMLILHGFYYFTKSEKDKSWIDLDKISFIDMICANFDEKEIKNLFDFLKSIDIELDNNDKKFLENLEKECFAKYNTENNNENESENDLNKYKNIVFVNFKDKKV